MEKTATRDAYGKVLQKLGELDKEIVVLDADLSGSTRTNKFAEKFPDRFFNMGIAEMDMTVTAAGLAAAGKKPFISTFAVFATGRAWEPIRQSIAHPKINVKIVATHAGITVGEDGASHQALEDITLMRVLPNMRVFVPADAVETEKLILEIAKDNEPAYVRLGRGKTPVIFDDNYKFIQGKNSKLRDGNTVSIFATGICVYESLKAADILKEKGINASVINVSSIKPIDEQSIIEEAEKTGKIVSVEEHNIIGGLGSAIAEVLVKNRPVQMEMIGINDRFGTSGNDNQLVKYFGLDSESIAKRIEDFIKKTV